MENLSNLKSNYLPSELKARWINKHPLIVTVSAFLIIKVLILTLFMVLFYILGDSVWRPPENINQYTGIDFFDLIGTRWDSNIYIPIAENGYIAINSPTDYRAWVFPPLYPFLIHLFVQYTIATMGSTFEIHYTVAAVIVTNIFSVFSVIVFFFMSKLYLSSIKAIYATLFFALFPPVFVFSTVAYSEPIFLTFGILSWYFFEKKNYKKSGIFLSLATLTRYEGGLLFLLYGIIYLGRIIRARGFKASLGVLVAIPFFPLIVTIKSLNIKFHSRTQKVQNFLNAWFNEYLDDNLSWILIWGLFPLLVLLYINNNAPLPISEIRRIFWGAELTFPFAGFFDILFTGNIKWLLDKYTFVFLITILGIFPLLKRPSISLIIISQIFFYTGYIAAGWSIVRYTGSIFQTHVILADEIPNSPKIFILILVMFFLYSFKVLWEFSHWSIWLI